MRMESGSPTPVGNRDKREFLEGHIKQAEEEAASRNMKQLKEHHEEACREVPASRTPKLRIGLKGKVDQRLREKQAGFRQDRSYTDHLVTLQIVVE